MLYTLPTSNHFSAEANHIPKEDSHVSKYGHFKFSPVGLLEDSLHAYERTTKNN